MAIANIPPTRSERKHIIVNILEYLNSRIFTALKFGCEYGTQQRDKGGLDLTY